jgi:pimeloyl-ACP methyl ester carboxylesterase
MSAAYPLAIARIGAHDIHYADEGRGFPLLLIHGLAGDPICPPACTRWMAQAIKHAETVVFEDSSHFFLMEESVRFMDTMNNWLARHTPRV